MGTNFLSKEVSSTSTSCQASFLPPKAMPAWTCSTYALRTNVKFLRRRSTTLWLTWVTRWILLDGTPARSRSSRPAWSRGSWIRSRIEIQSFNPVSIQATVLRSSTNLVYLSVRVCVCVCVCVRVHACVRVRASYIWGVFTWENRQTDMKNKQAGIAHHELKTNRKAWIFGLRGTMITINDYMIILEGEACVCVRLCS